MRVDVADVGPLPTLPPPAAGDTLSITVDGRPPIKTYGRSMRNATSTQRSRFMALRRAAIAAMAGRKWYEGGVAIDITYRAPSPPGPTQVDYINGVMDTLGGSHGPTFIYLPIVYLDDSQIVSVRSRPEVAPTDGYTVDVEFV